MDLTSPLAVKLQLKEANLLTEKIEMTSLKTDLTHGERAFSFCGPKLWNDLPSSIKQATSVDIFKKDLKTFLFNKDVNF